VEIPLRSLIRRTDGMSMLWEYTLRLVCRSKLCCCDREKLSSETKHPVASLNIAKVDLHSMKGSQCDCNETPKISL
jgi:hypothetical protein